MVVYKKREAICTLGGELNLLHLSKMGIFSAKQFIRALLRRTNGTSLLEEIQRNKEWHCINRPRAGITFLYDFIILFPSPPLLIFRF